MECIDEAADIVKSPSWIAAQCLHIVLSMLTLVLSLKFVLMLKKSSLFNSSTVYLLLLFTAFANLHAIVIIGMKVFELIRDTVMTDACDMTRKTSDCMILTYIVLSCVVGMVFCQNILWIDRLVATAFPAFHNRFCRVFAIILSSITTVSAFVLPFLLLRNDPYNDVVLTCLILPSGSAPQINRLFYSFVGLGLLAITALVLLYLINQRKEKMWRYRVKNSFQAIENQLITKWVGVVVSVQFVFLTAYSLAVYLIRTRGQALPKITREVLRMWFYLVPFSTVSLPLISLMALRHFTKERHASINRLTHMKNDHSTHMEQLMRMWS